MKRLSAAMGFHKENIVVVELTSEDLLSVVRETFAGGNTPCQLKRFRTLSRTWQVEACYEAGPLGYGLARILLKAGISCRVVASTLIPRRPGNRIKTDARDATELSLALRAGPLEFVRIPTLEEEEVRALVRCREDCT